LEALITTASGKRIDNWKRLQATTEFLTEFEGIAGIPVTETIQGGQPNLQGTWAIKLIGTRVEALSQLAFC
jgi:hypothetical protein